MEDWAYAASWENNIANKTKQISPIKVCSPESFNGYNRNNTLYSNDTQIKSMIYLIETANWKKPSINELGTDDNIFGEGISSHLYLFLI